MPRPKTKDELISAANGQFDKMWSLVESLSEEQLLDSFNFALTEKDKEAHWRRDQNVRDVLIHLYEWHQLLVTWIAANTKGNEQPFLPQPYNWKTYGKMNIEFWEKHQSTSYEEAEKLVKASHKQVLMLIEEFSENELFEKAYFTWTGTTNLGSYCISSTSSHYDWAIKKLKRYKKRLDA
ncbi:MAG: ClbS/DfsB family four-helix bundle protein [Raoultibacter sp.]|jgi:hypothetical protein